MERYEGSYEFDGLYIRWEATAGEPIDEVRLGIHGRPSAALGRKWHPFEEGFWAQTRSAEIPEIANVLIRFPSDLEVVPPRKQVFEYTDEEWRLKELHERRLIMAGRQTDHERELVAWTSILDRQRAESAKEVDETIRYANVVIVLVYGAFFAMWGGLGGIVEKSKLAESATLVMISLGAFVSFEVLVTFLRALRVKNLAGKIFGLEGDPETQVEKMGRIPTLERAILAFQSKIWVYLYTVAVATGLWGAVVLGAAAHEAVLRKADAKVTAPTVSPK